MLKDVGDFGDNWHFAFIFALQILTKHVYIKTISSLGLARRNDYYILLRALFIQEVFYLRSMGEAVGDVAFFMVIMFTGILIIAVIIVGTIYYFLLPEGHYAYKGLLRIIRKSSATKAELNKRQVELRKENETLQDCITYSREKFKALLTTEQQNTLAENIVRFSKGDCNFRSIDNENLAKATVVDLFHFGWNIGKRIITSRSGRKLGI